MQNVKKTKTVRLDALDSDEVNWLDYVKKKVKMTIKKVQLDALDSVGLNWLDSFKKTERNLQTDLFKKCVIFLSMEMNWNLIHAFIVLFFICIAKLF